MEIDEQFIEYDPHAGANTSSLRRDIEPTASDGAESTPIARASLENMSKLDPRTSIASSTDEHANWKSPAKLFGSASPRRSLLGGVSGAKMVGGQLEHRKDDLKGPREPMVGATLSQPIADSPPSTPEKQANARGTRDSKSIAPSSNNTYFNSKSPPDVLGAASPRTGVSGGLAEDWKTPKRLLADDGNGATERKGGSLLPPKVLNQRFSIAEESPPVNMGKPAESSSTSSSITDSYVLEAARRWLNLLEVFKEAKSVDLHPGMPSQSDKAEMNGSPRNSVASASKSALSAATLPPLKAPEQLPTNHRPETSETTSTISSSTTDTFVNMQYPLVDAEEAKSVELESQDELLRSERDEGANEMTSTISSSSSETYANVHHSTDLLEVLSPMPSLGVLRASMDRQDSGQQLSVPRPSASALSKRPSLENPSPSSASSQDVQPAPPVVPSVYSTPTRQTPNDRAATTPSRTPESPPRREFQMKKTMASLNVPSAMSTPPSSRANERFSTPEVTQTEEEIIRIATPHHNTRVTKSDINSWSDFRAKQIYHRSTARRSEYK